MTARQRQARARAILREIAEIGYALPGSLVTRTTACGKPGCRCKADPPRLHGPYASWLRRSNGRPVTQKLTPDQEQRYRPWFDNARRLRELVTELENLSVEAFHQAEGAPQQRKS
ncbi:MAG: DUF6788 family protein [Trebonia sp.]